MDMSMKRSAIIGLTALMLAIGLLIVAYLVAASNGLLAIPLLVLSAAAMIVSGWQRRKFAKSEL